MAGAARSPITAAAMPPVTHHQQHARHEQAAGEMLPVQKSCKFLMIGVQGQPAAAMPGNDLVDDGTGLGQRRPRGAVWRIA
jgi:hypothetical protein